MKTNKAIDTNTLHTLAALGNARREVERQEAVTRLALIDALERARALAIALQSDDVPYARLNDVAFSIGGYNSAEGCQQRREGLQALISAL